METVTLSSLKEQTYAMKESLRALKTNIQFCGDDVKTILITSAEADEGKSTVTMQLARSLTESGKNVLIIDTDMRKSVLVGRHQAQASNGEIKGLSHYLSGLCRLEEALYATNIPQLYAIFAGSSVPNPTEILEKKYFHTLLKFAKEHFDYVLVDSAPLTAAIDAAVVARNCDGAILVISQGKTSSRLIKNVKKQLEASGVNILGVVLNKLKTGKSNYYGYHSYYGKYYGKKD
ncbi:MAG: polysaccharide biosynthesis tyrosine autokinase [Agathobacter sp.]|nr:polysaccharide biosynthesis tyrosine autokinase [Agathobacter sp.]